MGRRLLWMGVLVCFFLLVKNYLADYAKLQDLKTKNKALEQKIALLNQEITQLKQEEDRLLHDSEYVEHQARRKLKMPKEGEIILDINSP